jgi:hypothetical protein
VARRFHDDPVQPQQGWRGRLWCRCCTHQAHDVFAEPAQLPVGQALPGPCHRRLLRALLYGLSRWSIALAWNALIACWSCAVTKIVSGSHTGLATRSREVCEHALAHSLPDKVEAA